MVEASSGSFDVRTDRQHLTTVAYGTGDLLADRQQIYRYMRPSQEPITDWLYGLVGGASAVTDPVVDIGTGNGQYLLALPDRWRVGLDLSSGMLNSARQAGLHAPLVVADAQALPLADNSAGTLLANHMLYHVPHIVVAVREARRVLSPGGVLLAATNGSVQTAKQLVALGHDTPVSSFAVEAGAFGLGLTDHTGVALAAGATPTRTEVTSPTDTTNGRYVRTREPLIITPA